MVDTLFTLLQIILGIAVFVWALPYLLQIFALFMVLVVGVFGIVSLVGATIVAFVVGAVAYVMDLLTGRE